MSNIITSAPTQNDIPRLKELWQAAFKDGDNWTNWFFENRFMPEQSLSVKVDDVLAGNMCIYPMSMKIRDTVFKSQIIGGLCVDPQYKGLLLVDDLMRGTMSKIRDMGNAFYFHTPVRYKAYYSYDNLEVVKRHHYVLPAQKGIFSKPNTALPKAEELLNIYNKFAQNYSGMVVRDAFLMQMQIDDCFADKGFCVKTNEAYALGAKDENTVYIVEICFTSYEALTDILQNIMGFELDIKFVLPENLAPPLNAKYESSDYSSFRVTDVSKTLSALKLDFDVCIGIEDNFLSNNNAVFLADGTKTNKAADITVDIGNFGQWICGYKDIFGHERIQGAAEKLNDTLTTLPTYTIEKY